MKILNKLQLLILQVRNLSLLETVARKIMGSVTDADLAKWFCQKGQDRGSEQLQASQPQLHPWKGDGTVCSGCHLHVIDEKVIMNSQFTKGKWWTAWPTWEHSMMSSLAGKMEGEQWMLCTLTSARLFTITHNILMGELWRCGIEKRTVKWVENLHSSESCDHWCIVGGLELVVFPRNWYGVQNCATPTSGCRDRMHPQQSCCWYKAGRSGSHTESLCCYSESLEH